MNPYQPPASDRNAPMSEPGKPPVHVLTEQYDRAIIVQRWLGCWVDLFGVIACLLIPDFVLGNALYQQTLGLWLLLAVAYFVVPEWRWGRTLGKLITGTVIVNVHGGTPGIGQVLVRTVFRLFEVNPLIAGGIPAGLAAAFGKRKQRIGDMVANTYVIFSKDLGKVRPVSPESA